VLDRDLCLPPCARALLAFSQRNNQRENMKNNTILGAVQAGRVLAVRTGAWGTFFPRRKGPPARVSARSCWCIDRRAEVLDVARSYVDAGADMIESNSFRRHALQAEHYGLADRVTEINEAAAKISCEAAGPSRWGLPQSGRLGRCW